MIPSGKMNQEEVRMVSLKVPPQSPCLFQDRQGI